MGMAVQCYPNQFNLQDFGFENQNLKPSMKFLEKSLAWLKELGMLSTFYCSFHQGLLEYECFDTPKLFYFKSQSFSYFLS